MKKKILLGLGDCSDRHCGVLILFCFSLHRAGGTQNKKDADSEEIRLICIFFAV